MFIACETSWLISPTILTGSSALVAFLYSIFFDAVYVLVPKGWSSLQRLLPSILRLR
jgi:hypothetical protein